MRRVPKPREWSGPMGSVCGEVEGDGARTVHIRLPHAVLTAMGCRIMSGWMARAAEWIEAKAKEEGGR